MKKSLKILGVGVGAGILIVGMLASNLKFINITSVARALPVSGNSAGNTDTAGRGSSNSGSGNSGSSNSNTGNNSTSNNSSGSGSSAGSTSNSGSGSSAPVNTPTISISSSDNGITSSTVWAGQHVELYIHGAYLGQYTCIGSGSVDFSGPQPCNTLGQPVDVGSPKAGTSITYTITATPNGVAGGSPISSLVTVTSQPDISVPVISVKNDSRTINLTLNSGGAVVNGAGTPYSKDFQYTVCWSGQCATTPWASTVIVPGNYDSIPAGVVAESEPTGAWTSWFGPGGGFGNNSVSVSVATRSLPDGELLYPQLGVQLSVQNPKPTNDESVSICKTTYFEGEFWNGAVLAPSVNGNGSFTSVDQCTAAGTPGSMRISIAGYINPADYDSPLAPTSTTGIATGTVNVISENSVTGGLVNAAWFAYAGALPSAYNMNVCLYANVPCSGTSRSYGNIPIGNTSMLNDPVGVSAIGAGSLYVLHGIEENSNIAIKESNNPLDELLAFSKDLFVSVANAENICGYMGTPGLQCPPLGNLPTSSLSVGAQTFTNPGDTANFILLWDPVAVMSIAPTSVPLDTVDNTLATTTVSNTGAPGSTLDWNAVTTYDANGSGWLSINDGSDQASGSLSAGDSSVVNFTASTTGLAAGTTYYATVKFSNSSNTYNDAYLTVTLTVATSTPPGCPNAPGCEAPTISVTASSSTITLGDSTQVTITSTGATSCTELGDWLGTSCGTTMVETPTTIGTFTYSASATNANGSAQDSATVTVAPPDCIGSGCGGGVPTINVTANPSSITLGSSTQVTIKSTGATSCTESGSWSGTSCGTTITETPTSLGTFTYSASSTNANGSAQASAIVTVTSSGCSGSNCPPPGGPSCNTFTATPSSIAPGSKSKLTYVCVDVTSCIISSYVNGQFTGESSGGPTGSESVGPSATTVYKLSCDAVNPQSVQVTVTNPGLNETNP